MNKKFIIYVLLIALTHNTQLNAKPEQHQRVLLSVLTELAALSPENIQELQKDPKAIGALAQTLNSERIGALCPKEIEPFLENPAISSLLKTILNS